jgi:hypothetical protein
MSAYSAPQVKDRRDVKDVYEIQILGQRQASAKRLAIEQVSERLTLTCHQILTLSLGSRNVLEPKFGRRGNINDTG